MAENSNKGEFEKRLEETILSVFPHSSVSVRFRKTFKPDFMVSFLLGKEPGDFAHGIKDNDTAAQNFSVEANEDGTLKDGAKVHGYNTCGRFYVKSKKPHMVYDSVKVGWRDFSGGEETIVKRVKTYFEKLKSLLAQHAEDLPSEAKKIMKEKYADALKESLVAEGTWAFDSKRTKELERDLDGLGNIGDLDSLKKKTEELYDKWWNVIGDDTFYDALDGVKKATDLEKAKAAVDDAAKELHKLETGFRHLSALALKKKRKNESRIMDFKTFMNE
jgi:uncharacterized protein YoxC